MMFLRTALLLLLVSSPAHAQLLLGGSGGFVPPVFLPHSFMISFVDPRGPTVPTVPTIWDASFKGPNVTLDSTSLIAATGGLGVHEAVLSLTALSTKQYAAFTLTTLGQVNGWYLGLGNHSTNVALYLGSDANSIVFTDNGGRFGFDASCADTRSWNAGDVIVMVVDFTASKLWTRLNGAWFSTDDPSANIGGCAFTTFAARGPYYMGWSGYNGSVVTANFTGSIVDAKLAGFSPLP